MRSLKVIKVGGEIVEHEKYINEFLYDFSTITDLKLLVHGGGRLASKIADKLGVENKIVDGRRITDKETLQIVTMVYGGLVNKQIVAILQSLGVNAMGLTGADLNLLLSIKRPVKTIDYGYVGDIKYVNHDLLKMILEKGITPILAPLTHDGNGTILNTNADTIASEIAKALSIYFDVSLIYCFGKNGVLMDENDDNSAIEVLNKSMYEEYKKTGIIKGGMIPKLDNAFNALDSGVTQVVITSAKNITDLSSGKCTVVTH